MFTFIWKLTEILFEYLFKSTTNRLKLLGPFAGGSSLYVIVDQRELVTSGYARRFWREGIASAGFRESQFIDWAGSAAASEMRAVEAFLIGDCPRREELPRLIRSRSPAPVVALNEAPQLEETLALFQSGVDDVVRKPFHLKELLARIEAIRRRVDARRNVAAAGPIEVFFDGADCRVNGAPLALPRRERRVLEHLVSNKGRRVTRTQIFDSVYGVFDDATEEAVVESHISRLRKKLKARLGYDPIDCRRFLGYMIRETDIRVSPRD